ncbi:MAG: 50S ribosomal protein L10 [Candidatus Liptonbacteria bacterium]|nr:50S ribosomal protein L10 [Candidatus Liptonbacteria bacterium]
MKTREQKTAQIEKAKAMIGKNASLLFVDFSGIDASSINALKAKLRGMGATMNVVKKRLMTIALRTHGIAFDAHEAFEGQAATVASPGDVADVAAVVHGFGKDKTQPKLLGGLDIAARAFIDATTTIALAKLPSRPVLLGQLLGTIGSPVAGLIAILDARRTQIEAK